MTSSPSFPTNFQHNCGQQHASSNIRRFYNGGQENNGRDNFKNKVFTAICVVATLFLHYLGLTKKRPKSTCTVLLSHGADGQFPYKDQNATRFVCISDTHNGHDAVKIPSGDVLIHAGDFTDLGTDEEMINFNSFLGTLPHPHKLVVSGNHDHHWQDIDDSKSWMVWSGLRRSRLQLMLFNATCLLHEEITINGIRIHGSCWNYNDPRRFYDRIRSGIDVLITHKPPLGVLDGTGQYGSGDQLLIQTVHQIRPRVHVFGHIHESYGTKQSAGTLFINAAICDTKTKPTHEPIVFDILL